MCMIHLRLIYANLELSFLVQFANLDDFKLAMSKKIALGVHGTPQCIIKFVRVT